MPDWWRCRGHGNKQEEHGLWLNETYSSMNCFSLCVETIDHPEDQRQMYRQTKFNDCFFIWVFVRDYEPSFSLKLHSLFPPHPFTKVEVSFTLPKVHPSTSLLSSFYLYLDLLTHCILYFLFTWMFPPLGWVFWEKSAVTIL